MHQRVSPPITPAAPPSGARQPARAHTHRSRGLALAALALALLLGTLAGGIVLIQAQSRSQVLAALGLRGTSSATFVSAFLAQQADREQDTAGELLAEPKVSGERFRTVVAAFGSDAAVLLDSAGRVLAVAPSDPRLLGKPIATRYAHLAAAERGRVAVSNVVPSAVGGVPVAAVAVPFASARGRRVLSVAYGVSGSTLEAFVDHTISYRQHQVYLVDPAGHLVAASPRTHASSLEQAAPSLARAVTRSSLGSVPGAGTPSSFTVAAVPGTSWRVIIAVPDSRLYASVGGWAARIPWVVFALVSVLGALLLALFARVTALSRSMARSAHRDSLTGLFNRRALSEHLTRAAARARRRGEPMSVLMIDLDRFKEINDSFGHAAGDRVLRAVADCMRDVLRAEDVYGRWGGDEFLVLMPAGDEADARVLAARLHAAAAASAAGLGDIGLADGVQMSIGTATAVHTSPEEIVHAADLALYEDKSSREAARGAAVRA
jgi:diguanylate cyclase (GGDEF)-like protein